MSDQEDEVFEEPPTSQLISESLSSDPKSKTISSGLEISSVEPSLKKEKDVETVLIEYISMHIIKNIYSSQIYIFNLSSSYFSGQTIYTNQKVLHYSSGICGKHILLKISVYINNHSIILLDCFPVVLNNLLP